MNPQLATDIEAQFGVMSSLGPAPKLHGPDKTVVHCLNCHRPMSVTEIRRYWTGLCHASDTICFMCRRLFPKHALVACLKCQEVVARMAPEVMASGFRIEALKCYHIASCPKCKEGVKSSPILEGEYYFRTMGHRGPVRETFSGIIK